MTPIASTAGLNCTRMLPSGRHCSSGARAGGLHAAEGTTRCEGVADAMGRCTRIACAAVLVFVLLGDNTAARGESWGHQGHGLNAHGWPSASSAFVRLPYNGCTSRTSLQLRRASLSGLLEARRARNVFSRSAPGTSGGSTVATDDTGSQSPAFAFSVKSPKRAGPGQQGGAQGLLLSPTDADRVVDERGLLQSPRFAAAEEGKSYPERLQVTAVSLDTEATSTGTAKGISLEASETRATAARPLLPELSKEDLRLLQEGERVQKQTRLGGSGSGSVVVDVRADPDVVMGLLTSYRDYSDMIDTVRRCTVFPRESRDPDSTTVEVTVSRFKLRIRVVMTRLRDLNMVKFELDPNCTKAGRAVLREATGFFYVESPPDRPGYSRVWLMAAVDVNRFVPGAIVDYAAARALPRASVWLKPACETAQRKKMRTLAA